MRENEAHRPVLVGLDVHGIQAYLFGTSKLKEVVGASRIVDDFTGPNPDDVPTTILAGLGLSSARSGKPSGSGWFVPVRLGGGAVRLLLPSESTARAFVRAMSEWALAHADGLEFDAAWVPFDLDAGALDAADGELVERINKARQAATRGNAFNGFPFTAPCRLTGDPAEGYDGPNERLCRASLDKREYQNSLDDRWASLSGEGIFDAFRVQSARRPFIFNLEDLCGDAPADSYMAVVALDMNSLGEIGRKRRAGTSGCEALHASRGFVEEITDATTAAFCDALNALTTNESSRHEFDTLSRTVDRTGVLPLRPLVLGGDDLTFVMHGALAPRFAHALANSLAKRGFHSGVGIAFVKVKSPLSRAIELAEALLARAKAAGRDQSHIDFMLCTGEVAIDASSRGARGPYTLEAFARLLENARVLKHDLPSSHVRGAVDGFRENLSSGRDLLKDLEENIDRGLGGAQQITKEARELIRGMLNDDALAASYVDCVDLFRFIAPRPDRDASRDIRTKTEVQA
jgi:hypothetical protein